MNHSDKVNALERISGSHGARMCMLTSSLVAFILGSCSVSEKNSDDSHTEAQQPILTIPFQSIDDILAGKSPIIGKSFYPEMQDSLEKANQESQGHVDDNNIVIEE